VGCTGSGLNRCLKVLESPQRDGVNNPELLSKLRTECEVMGPSLKEMNWKQHLTAIGIAGFLFIGQLASGNLGESVSGSGVAGVVGFLAGVLIVSYGLVYVFGEEPDGGNED